MQLRLTDEPDGGGGPQLSGKWGSIIGAPATDEGDGDGGARGETKATTVSLLEGEFERGRHRRLELR
jgi:hypothetical protein